MPPVVVPREPVFVNLKDHLVDHGYRWIHVTPFDLTAPDAPDAEIIAAVMDSVPYRNGHIGGGVDPLGTIHGPFRIECMTVTDYEPLATAVAVERFDRWVDVDLTASAEFTQILAEVVHRRLRAADAVYFLRDLGDDALCDYGRIHGEYNEFLTVDRPRREVALILAGDD
ncbi:hypothetical protein [Nocardia neocaledoniensis]|uniref:hypothetical protein n=1 Tax=Nocardia neocaledoniensis TaxID=236511 RepID=UPI0024545D14|nr:hypothetical protein [Nocardia neocaledoniensis]